MQLVAYGAQDIYLTGNPSITFFKTIYKRHTNFAIETIEQTINGEERFGSELTCTLNLNGDLITKIYLKCNVSLTGTNGNFAWINRLGHLMLLEIDLLIGGDKIDRQYGEWLNIWYELARYEHHDRGYNKMIGNYEKMTKLSTEDKNATLYIPLKFFFNKFNGLAIPIIALDQTNIVINFTLRNSSELIVKESSANVVASISNISLLCNYIFLDNDERQRFASLNHEYLIEQVQFSGIETVDKQEETYSLNFFHPCKSLYWFVKNGNYINGLKFLYYLPDIELSNRQGFNNKTNDLIKFSTIRYVLSQMYSNNGIVNLKLNGTGNITANSDSVFTEYEANSISSADGLATIRANYNSITIDTVNNSGTISVNNLSNWEVVKYLTISKVSEPISDVFQNITRTTDILNLGHSNYDIIVYNWINYGKFLDGSYNPVLSSLLKLNGHHRFSEQKSEFFNYLQPYETHRSTPKDGINLYSFALNPLEHQPSGTCNFSRIDVSSMDLTFDNEIVSIPGNQLVFYTINYNIFRIASGLGGVAYTT